MTVSTHDFKIIRQERDLYLKAFEMIVRKLSTPTCCGYCVRVK